MYALVSDCTPNNGTVEAISKDAGELIDLATDDAWRAIVLDEPVNIGDRIAIDWDSQRVNLSECI